MLQIPVSRDGESVWLSANQMAVLFDKDETNIRKHINNIFRSSEVDRDKGKSAKADFFHLKSK